LRSKAFSQSECCAGRKMTVAKEQHRAPLIHIPVEPERASARERFSVKYNGDEIGTNTWRCGLGQ